MPGKNDPRLDRGLELYGHGLHREAVALWQGVLDDDPGNLRARDYLETAGYQTSTFASVPDVDAPPADERRAGAGSWRAEVIELVRQHNFEGALSRLYAERRRFPRDAEISASIQRLKEHRLHNLAVAIGGLDRVIFRHELLPGTTVEHAVVARLVDDVATAEDIARTSPIGVIRTLEVLLELVGHGPSDASGSHSVDDIHKQFREPSRDEDPFDVAFRNGTKAYLERRFGEAEQLFERCLELRPGEPRAALNLQRLRARKP